MSVDFDIARVERRVAQFADPDVRRTALAPPGTPPFNARLAGEVEVLVRQAAKRANVEPALALAVARTESGFDPRACSASGAVGPMQLMPATARAVGVENPYDPAQNVRGGATYLRELLDRFGGDVPSAVAAYNAGPAAVERARGAPPFPETQTYVARVLAAYRAYRFR